jgi:molybdopterin-guanine dinucleotide biosynthesis protein A
MTTASAGPVAGVVLAGGGSRRLGRDKALLTVGGETLLARAVRVLAQVTQDLLVVGPVFRSSAVAASVVPDVRPGLGPLGGIYSALLATSAPYVLVVACDMPFLQPDLLRHLLSLRAGYDVVLPWADGRGQHLHAVYAASCRDIIGRHLDGHDLRVDSFFDEVCVRRVEPDELRRFDPQLRSFYNVNTQEDWALAQTLG